MTESITIERSKLFQIINTLPGFGTYIFSFAIISLGIETFLCGVFPGTLLIASNKEIPVIPWLPAVPAIALLSGAIWVICGTGLLSRRTAFVSSIVLSGLFFLFTLIIDVPNNIANIMSISLRTRLFEPLTIACLAFLLPGLESMPKILVNICRYLLALSLIVFGIDHFLALAFIATLLPAWIPWHTFRVAFFGAGFIAAGLSIAFNLFHRLGAACIGLMFAVWVITLHLPRVLGLYPIPGASGDPNEWSSLFIAAALWGGFWAYSNVLKPDKKMMDNKR